MPYLKCINKELINLGTVPKSAAELNYKVSALCNEMLKEKGVKYSEINALIGALECAKMELYRRIASPYEDVKIEENGDVYTIGE